MKSQKKREPKNKANLDKIWGKSKYSKDSIWGKK